MNPELREAIGRAIYEENAKRLEACEEFLKGWGIDTENDWYIPKESEDLPEKP